MGLGFASFGTGGGGAAVWGAAASGDIDMCSAGIDTGGELGKAGDVVLAWPLGRPDIIARRVRTVEGRHGTRKDDRQTRKRDIEGEQVWWYEGIKPRSCCLRIPSPNHIPAILSTYCT